MLGISQRLEHRPNELSGGEQQRVALARALINRPAIVLADEPTGNLDSKSSAIVLNMLRQSNKDLGQTVLMITHNPEAAEYGDRIVHMRDGEIVAPTKIPVVAHPPSSTCSPDFIKTLCFMQAATGVVSRAYRGVALTVLGA